MGPKLIMEKLLYKVGGEKKKSMLPKLFMRLAKFFYGTEDSTAKIAYRPLLGKEAG